MKKVIIATHGTLASGFKDSAKLIAGNVANDIVCYELFPGKSAEDFVLDIKEKYLGKYELVILCDLFGASVSNEMYKLKNEKNVEIVSGINLAMLIDVLLDDSKMSKEKIEEYRENIVYINEVMEDLESEDF